MLGWTRIRSVTSVAGPSPNTTRAAYDGASPGSGAADSQTAEPGRGANSMQQRVKRGVRLGLRNGDDVVGPSRANRFPHARDGRHVAGCLDDQVWVHLQQKVNPGRRLGFRHLLTLAAAHVRDVNSGSQARGSRAVQALEQRRERTQPRSLGSGEADVQPPTYHGDALRISHLGSDPQHPAARHGQR